MELFSPDLVSAGSEGSGGGGSAENFGEAFEVGGVGEWSHGGVAEVHDCDDVAALESENVGSGCGDGFNFGAVERCEFGVLVA